MGNVQMPSDTSIELVYVIRSVLRPILYTDDIERLCCAELNGEVFSLRCKCNAIYCLRILKGLSVRTLITLVASTHL